MDTCSSDNVDTPVQISDEEEEDGEECETEIIPESDDFTEEPSDGSKCDGLLQADDGDYQEDIDDNEIINLDIMESVRCGAHTAQLAVWDVLREYKTRLSNINKLYLKMHNKANRQIFLFHKTALPPKVCETRWNIWYLLLRYLKELEGSPVLALLQNNDIGKNII